MESFFHTSQINPWIVVPNASASHQHQYNFRNNNFNVFLKIKDKWKYWKIHIKTLFNLWDLWTHATTLKSEESAFSHRVSRRKRTRFASRVDYPWRYGTLCRRWLWPHFMSTPESTPAHVPWATLCKQLESTLALCQSRLNSHSGT